MPDLSGGFVSWCLGLTLFPRGILSILLRVAVFLRAKG